MEECPACGGEIVHQPPGPEEDPFVTTIKVCSRCGRKEPVYVLPHHEVEVDPVTVPGEAQLPESPYTDGSRPMADDALYRDVYPDG